MEIDVIVPVRRRTTVDRLLMSFSRNTVWPHSITLVSNEFGTEKVRCHGLNVRILRFESDEYPIGSCDAALRRNVGIWASEASHVMTFDDDQIAPADLIQSTLRVLSTEPYCWGHHRFIDFSRHSVDEITALSPEVGRPRETPPNTWHSWRSAYAGLFASERTLLRQSGGFDMIFSGRHGGEDQDLGRRLARLVHNSEAVYVHEPPFAWHPEKNIPWDELRHSNVCAGEHEIVNGQIHGVAVHRCARCPFYWVPDEVLLSGQATIPFDVSCVHITIEQLDSDAQVRLSDVFTFLTPARLTAAKDSLCEAYVDYVHAVSTPDMAISMQTAAFLSALCEGLKPQFILDLGSGFSSFVLRLHATATSQGVVWTIDDDLAWLERTRDFLDARRLETDNMLLWRGMPSSKQFDLVFYDLDGMAMRARELRNVLEHVGPTAILVLDDMHKEEYAPEVERTLRTGRWRYFDASACTMDQYGRFCGVVVSATHPLLRHGRT